VASSSLESLEASGDRDETRDEGPSSSSSYPAIKFISESSESKLLSKSDDSEDIVIST